MFWQLSFENYLLFGSWNLEFLILKYGLVKIFRRLRFVFNIGSFGNRCCYLSEAEKEVTLTCIFNLKFF